MSHRPGTSASSAAVSAFSEEPPIFYVLAGVVEQDISFVNFPVHSDAKWNLLNANFSALSPTSKNMHWNIVNCPKDEMIDGSAKFIVQGCKLAMCNLASYQSY